MVEAMIGLGDGFVGLVSVAGVFFCLTIGVAVTTGATLGWIFGITHAGSGIEDDDADACLGSGRVADGVVGSSCRIKGILEMARCIFLGAPGVVTGSVDFAGDLGSCLVSLATGVFVDSVVFVVACASLIVVTVIGFLGFELGTSVVGAR